MELKSDQMLQGGKYRIVEKIGQGGFAITYKAVWKTEITGAMGAFSTDITVAVKEFFFKDYCSRDANSSNVTITSAAGGQVFVKFKEKLKKEAAILSRLRHPNIVSVFDIFEENNTVYMVMEYVEGGSLKERIAKSGKLDEATVLRYTEQLCGAVTEIHRNNVLHLDIKPGNILIDPNNNVRLIDFGISKQYNSDTHAETSTTPVGISKGFAPPEQYTGVSQFSPATDVYAVGATIYNMLSGNVPPESMTLLENALPPIPGVSGKLWDAIVNAMSPLRPQRPQSAAELWGLFENNAPAVVKPVEDDKTEVDISGVSSQPKDDKTEVESASEAVDNSAYSTRDVENESESDDTDDEEAGGKKKIWLWLLGVLAVAGVGVGAYFWLNKGAASSNLNDLERMNLKGDVSWIKQHTYLLNDTTRNLYWRHWLNLYDYDNDLHDIEIDLIRDIPYTYYEFNDTGNIAYAECTDGYLDKIRCNYGYFENGNISYLRISADNGFEISCDYNCDDSDNYNVRYLGTNVYGNGKTRQNENNFEISVDGDEETILFYSQEYDSVGVSRNALYSTVVITREDGRIIKREMTSGDHARWNDTYTHCMEYSYNNNGDIEDIDIIIKHGSEKISINLSFEYEYDDNDNWVERRIKATTSTDEELTVVTEREIGYGQENKPGPEEYVKLGLSHIYSEDTTIVYDVEQYWKDDFKYYCVNNAPEWLKRYNGLGCDISFYYGDEGVSDILISPSCYIDDEFSELIRQAVRSTFSYNHSYGWHNFSFWITEAN